LKRPEIYLEPKPRTSKIIELLEKQYPNAKTALNYTNPLEILVATMLSAQTTDVQVNRVTQKLFKKYHSPEDYANADLKELEQDIHSTGFYHNKARNLQNCCKLLVDKFHSQVPKTMEELLELPGVARKTANIVLYNAYGAAVGIAVDTHVRRLSERLGLTKQKDHREMDGTHRLADFSRQTNMHGKKASMPNMHFKQDLSLSLHFRLNIIHLYKP
jgi:endonuclease-3